MDPGLKTVFARVCSAAGLLALVEHTVERNSHLVFALHRVLPDEEMAECYNPYLAITPDSLERFIEFVRGHLRVVPLAELLIQARNGNNVKERLCALTFDDGWEDNYRVAWPVLKRLGTPATIFLVTGLVGTGDLMPEERLWRLWQHAKNENNLSNLLPDLQQALNSPFAKRLEEIHSAMKDISSTEKITALDRLEKTYGRTPTDRSRFMSWDQIREMRKGGISFGSHTVRHAILSKESPEVIRKELDDSKRTLEEQLGCLIEFHAYPSGGYDAQVLLLAKEAGYKAAVTTDSGPVKTSCHPFAIPRVALDNFVVNDGGGTFSPARARVHILRGHFSRSRNLSYELGSSPS